MYPSPSRLRLPLLPQDWMEFHGLRIPSLLLDWAQQMEAVAEGCPKWQLFPGAVGAWGTVGWSGVSYRCIQEAPADKREPGGGMCPLVTTAAPHLPRLPRPTQSCIGRIVDVCAGLNAYGLQVRVSPLAGLGSREERGWLGCCLVFKGRPSPV